MTNAIIATSILGMTSIGIALPAFPGAEGPGADATGGRGKEVYHVTNLNNDGQGSFRDAVSKSDRVIVFDVSGTVTLQPPGSKGWIKSGSSNLTIAGETAPGDGFTIRGQGVKFNGHNVIVRNLKLRPGKDQERPGISTNDGFTNYLQNSIIDHVSVSWADDEALSSTDAAANCTVQYCLIAESLNYRGHGYGCLIASEVPNTPLSYHHNLFANVRSRLPRLGTERAVGPLFNFSNNIIYNWAGNAGYSANDIDSNVPLPSRTNFIGNYYISGNDTKEGDAAFRGANDVTRMWIDPDIANKWDDNHNGKLDGTDRSWDFFAGIITRSDKRFEVNPGYIQKADDAYEQVLNCSGASWWRPDAVDGRALREARAQGGQLVNDPSDVGGWPVTPEVKRDESFDTDQDGMSDAWEIANGLNPKEDDHNRDFDQSGYTNIEKYFHSLAAFPSPKAIGFTGKNGRYEVPGNWDLSWLPDRYVNAAIEGAQVTIDSLGKSAAKLSIDQSGKLTVSAGSIHVSQNLEIGKSNDGSVEQTGGKVGVSKFLIIGEHGTYNQSAGELNAGGIIVKPGGKLVLSGTFSPGADVLGFCRVDQDLDLSHTTLRIDVAKTGTGEDRIEMPSYELTIGGKVIINSVHEHKIAPKTKILFARVKALHGKFSEMPEGWTLETAEKIENTYNQKYLEVYLVAPK